VALPTTRGFHRARLPVVAEAWLDLAPEAMKHDTHVACYVNVNRTPITSEVSGFYQRRAHELWIDGRGLQHDVAVGHTSRARPEGAGGWQVRLRSFRSQRQ
jgi:hypothetical protein